MKVRVRFPKKKKSTDSGPQQAKSVVLHVEHANPDGHVTLGDLKRVVIRHVGGDEAEAWKRVSVSLNGTTPLSSPDSTAGDDETSLPSLGICSGDLIWVLDMPPAEECTDTDMEEGSTGRTELVPVQMGIVDHTLYEAREYVLQNHLKLDRCDSVALLIHAAMLACGFDSRVGFGDITEQCKVTPSLHRILYNLRVEANGDPSENWDDVCEICISNMPGSSCVAHVNVKRRMDDQKVWYRGHTFDSVPHIDTFLKTDSVVGDVPDTLREFWNSCKDELCLPALYLCIWHLGLNYSPRASLLMMPSDVKQHILSKMDYRDVCACSMTCREMRHAGSDNSLWLQLLEQYFPDQKLRESQASNMTHGYAKSVFRTAMTASLERKRERRRASSLQVPPGPRFPQFPGTHRPQFPGIIGGEYDRLPGVPFGQPPGLPGRGFGPAGFSSSGGRGNQQWRLG